MEGLMKFLKFVLLCGMFPTAGAFIVYGLSFFSKKMRVKSRFKSIKEQVLASLTYMVLGMVIGWLAFKWAFPEDKYRALRPYLSNYAEVQSTAPDLLFDSDSAGYIKGKVIVIDKAARQQKKIHFFLNGFPFSLEYWVDDGQLSHLQRKLKNELSAERPEDVGTVVWLIWDKKPIYYYTGDVEASQILCTVEIYDSQEKKLIKSKFFEGEYPQKAAETSGSFNGNPPLKAILAYLSSLPRISLMDRSLLSPEKIKRE